MPDRLPSGPRYVRRWFLLGCLAQLLVLVGDHYTPLGFAHGVLYSPAIALGLIARSRRAVWGLAALGVLGCGVGALISPGQVSGISETFVILNRLMGVGAVLFTAFVAHQVLALAEARRRTHDKLERAASLLEVSSEAGRLGGWRVELPSQETVWSPEVFHLLDTVEGPAPDLESAISLYVPEHREAVRQAFEACVRDGASFEGEYQVYRRGAPHWVRVLGRAVRAPSGEIIRVEGAIQDIDASKQVALALDRSRAEWKELADSLPMMVWVGEKDGSLSYMNRFSAEYLGTTVDELVGNGWLQYVAPEYQEEVMAKWATAREPGGHYEAEFNVRRADGSWRWHLARAERVELPGGIPRWYGTAIDVQQVRDEREARLHLSSRLVETMESVTDAIFLLDRDWKVIYLNAHAEELLQRNRDDLIGKNVWDEFPEARDSEFHRQYAYSIEHQVMVRFEAAFGPVGKLFEVNAYPSLDGIAVYFRDITELRRVSDQLQQAQRLDALGQLTGGVAHDFNNLLTVIVGNAEMLEEKLEDARQRQMATMILGAARRAAELTQRLLAFARKQALEPREVDINALVRGFVPLVEQTLGEQVTVQLELSGERVQSRVDPIQLEVGLLNLAVNARDAMPGGGCLRICTANVEARADDALRAAQLPEGDYVRISVSDTGEGIPPEMLQRVFEPFFTTKEVGKGTGLGLAMVYGFAKQSRGHVAIESAPGQGTTVHIYLPGSDSEVQATQAKAGGIPVAARRGLQVLLVDDDDMVRTFAARLVGSLGYQVVQARNGEEALAKLAEHPDLALLFTDVVMRGGMSGRALADAARALRPGLPVLYTSGYAEDAIVHEGQLEPGVLLLRKPYSITQMSAKLDEALQGTAMPVRD